MTTTVHAATERAPWAIPMTCGDRYVDRGLRNRFNSSTGGGPDHGFGDRGAVDHLVERDRKRGPALGRLRERLEARARDVALRGFPNHRLALDRLKHTAPKQPR